MRANGQKIDCRHAGPPASLRIGAMTLTSCAWLAILTRSPWRSSELRKVPTTTASVTLYVSSIRRGCSRQPFDTLCGWSSVSRPVWYQTFHSSNEMSTCFVCLPAALTAVDGGHDPLDERVHVDGRREEALRVAVVLLVVRVHRDVVDLVVRVGEHLVLPGAEGRHAAARAADRDQLDRVVDELHRLGGLLGEPPVLGGGLVADLPRAVEFVAEAPELDVEGVLRAVGDAPVD